MHVDAAEAGTQPFSMEIEVARRFARRINSRALSLERMLKDIPNRLLNYG